MKKLGPLEFTDTQWEILSDRLLVPQAIADAIGVKVDYEDDEITDAVELLLERKWEEAVDKYSRELALAVIVDAVRGSTWIPRVAADPQVSPQELNGQIQSGESLAEKLRDFTGDSRIAFPVY